MDSHKEEIYVNNLFAFINDKIESDCLQIIGCLHDLPNPCAYVVSKGLEDENEAESARFLKSVVKEAFQTSVTVPKILLYSSDLDANDDFRKQKYFSRDKYKHIFIDEINEFSPRKIKKLLNENIKYCGDVIENTDIFKIKYTLDDNLSIYTNIEIKPKRKTISFNHTHHPSLNLIAYDYKCVNILSILGFWENELDISNLKYFNRCCEFINISFLYYKEFTENILKCKVYKNE